MIHFVYAAPTSPALAPVVMAQRLGLPLSYVGRRDRVSTERWAPRAPATITAHVYQALRERAATKLYDVRERVVIAGGDEDVLIGHYLAGHDDGVWQRSCREGRFALRIAMNPLHHGMPEICGELAPYIPLVDRIFGVMGPYWYDTWRQSALADWFPKIVPFDMAIDIAAFPRFKTSFNPAGRRQFLYIGWAGVQKGTHLLSELFGLAPHHHCVAVGPSTPIPNLECRPKVRFTEAYLRRLLSECDFLLVPGVSDANPTVVLEAMAWGLPVACTPQSGYYDMPEILSLSIRDMGHNVDVLEFLQQADERELFARADAARSLVATKYTWTSFVSRFINALNDTAEQKGLRPVVPGRADAVVR